MTTTLFSFGTLRDPDLFAAVVGRPLAAFASEEAHLPGHAAVHAEGFAYPVLVPAAGDRLVGLLVDGLTSTEIDRVQFYETLEYVLQPVRIETRGGARAAHCFFASERLAASSEGWLLEAWQAGAKRRAVVEAATAMEFFGRIGLDEINAHWPEVLRLADAWLATADAEAAAVRRRA